MNGCLDVSPAPRFAVCHLSEGHSGRHSWETEEQFLDRVAPEPVPNVGWRYVPAPDPAAAADNSARELNEIVDLGAHYRARGGVEPIDFITSNNLTFCEGNVVKYVARWRSKNGLEDLRKARWYIDRLIAQAEGEGK